MNRAFHDRSPIAKTAWGLGLAILLSGDAFAVEHWPL